MQTTLRTYGPMIHGQGNEAALKWEECQQREPSGEPAVEERAIEATSERRTKLTRELGPAAGPRLCIRAVTVHPPSVSAATASSRQWADRDGAWTSGSTRPPRWHASLPERESRR